MTNRWDGIANGDQYTMLDKVRARRDQDLPEDNQRDWATMVGEMAPPDWIVEVWRGGLVDLITNEQGEGAICFTPEQADALQYALERRQA